MDRVRYLVETAREVAHIPEAGRRAAVERWLLEYAALNVHLDVIQAVVVAEQLARRYGYWAITDERSWDRLCRVPLRTELEWSLDGVYPADFARPISTPGPRDGEVELFLPEDVPGAPLDERSELVGHRDVAAPEVPVPDFMDFADCVGERERAMLGKIVEVHGLVRWEVDLPGGLPCQLDFEDPEETEIYGGEIYFHLNISPFAANRGVMGMVLQLTAELMVLYLLGVLEDPGDVEPDAREWASPLELELAAWLAGRRLRLDARTGPVAAGWLMDPHLPAPEELRWALVFDVAEAVEGTLLGHRYQVND
ncbi:hypothetical protein [Corynebacterium comes]|uniref:Uncharacterized protein n=1 Tax=Corynebacterium comes TaxID=2675218 RepID=A0A6B8W3C8_9CORY|nr:hypothetical protein [Corynebacterium comes]QGU04310.1 hypothetical protein CETAM_05195 [Corynebacterium comes]